MSYRPSYRNQCKGLQWGVRRSGMEARQYRKRRRYPTQIGCSFPFTDPDHGVTSTETDIAIIAGVIAAVAFVLVCLLFVMLHYMYRHKGTYYTNEAKGTEFAENADTALQGDPALQDAGDSSRKEYFI
ncbi:glycophorin-C [Orycteropus afer afer]|uniref:Glycophorin-C n=1 Tax=Orycteropus afer afer TaxID=1230840 RepID=A0AC54Z5B6_ORYAF|nr:glycophorin-C [Orycteropus afer afer]